MAADIRKPSEFIKSRQDKNCKIYCSNKLPPSSIMELIRNTDLDIQQCHVPFDQTLFRPEPTNIVLEKFVPFKTYELVINFRNMDKVPRKIRLEPSNSPFFSVVGWKNNNLQSEKVAPGMEIPFVVKFTPEENTDYIHNLVCETEREKFIVPIRAIGARGLLDISDEIVFSQVPVKIESSKTVLVRNIGDAVAKFQIETDGRFSCTPKTASVQVGESIQVTIQFHPKVFYSNKNTGSFKSSMFINYHSGDKMVVDLIGTAENVNVRLEKSQIKFESSITLTTKKTFQIFNRSEHMVQYKWMQFASQQDEEHEKAKRNLFLTASERKEIENGSQNSVWNDVSLIKRKYGNMNRKINEQSFDFDSNVFRIEPSHGVIWPHSSAEVNVFFNSKKVGDFNQIAYCEIQGRESRLPMQLKGVSIGPKVKFSFTLFKINEIFINTHQQYEILLENLGDIATNYSLRDTETLFGPQFKFSPSSGRINVGEQILITVTFSPTALGDFKETFLWDLEGDTDPIYVSYEGTIVGPTFHFDCEKLIIPPASFGFSVEKELLLENTSPISMQYELLIFDENGDEELDISLTPKSGSIDGNSFANINVLFCPKKIGPSSGWITVNVNSVGKDLLRIPFESQALVPDIRLLKPSIKLDECFLDYPYVEEITFVNDSVFPATYLIDQRDQSKNVFSYQFNEYQGVIAPNSKLTIPVEICVKRLGIANFPIIIRIQGAEAKPLVIEVMASGIGPELKLSRNEIDWGKIHVLQQNKQVLELENLSPIPANFLCNLLGDLHTFQVEPMEGTIMPGEKTDLIITAHLDDSVKFTDVLSLSVVSSETHEIPIVARGIGSTIVFDESLKEIDFNDVFSNKDCSKSFTLYNKGRRTHHLNWTHVTTKDPEILSQQIFEVIPSRFTLKPGSHQVIFVKGYSNVPVKINDKLVCHTTTDKDPSRKVLVESNIKVSFINPALQISPPELVFTSSHTTDDSFVLLKQYLNIQNTTGLSLNMNFKCPEPFTISEEHLNLTLNAGEIATVPVTFDPTHNLSRISQKEHKKLTISYKEHPQKYFVDLHSQVYFPNLTFSDSTLSFGCIQNDVEEQKTIQMTNSSELPVAYQWFFVTENEDEAAISRAFDIQPIRGYIKPGQTVETNVFFYGQADSHFHIKAMCDVSGGPKYELSLQGDSSDYSYLLDMNELNFGTIAYQSIVDQDITITNQGKVAFDFKFLIPKSSKLQDSLMITPSSGSIAAGEKQKIVVRFSPCIPDTFSESFFIKVANFEPQKIMVNAKATFPRIGFSLPLEKDSVFQSTLSKLQEKNPNISEGDYQIDKEILKRKTMDFLTLQDPPLKSIGNYVGSPLLFSKGFSKNKEKSLPTLTETSSVIQSTFLCDLGTVVKNTHCKKSFSVKNLGNSPVSFSFLKGTHSNLFSIEPEKVKFLPSGENVDIIVTFYAKSEEKYHCVEIPVCIQGGPTHLIRFQVGISIPDFVIGEMNRIDFGEVVVGYRKSATLSIVNPNPVPCEWTSVYEDGPRKQKKALINVLKDFVVEPSHGYIEPFERSTITIRFSPSEQREYSFEMPFKVSMNPNARNFYVTANSIKPAIAFEPSELSFGPVLPYSEGCEVKVTMKNMINQPLEIYSSDFDTQFKADEDALKQLEGYENGILYLPPKDFSVSITEFVMQQLKKKVEKKDDLGQELGVGELIHTTASTIPNLNENSSSDGPVCVIFHGAPLSGKTVHSKRIAGIFHKRYITLDQIFDNHMQTNESVSSLHRSDASEEKAGLPDDQIHNMIRSWVQKENWSNSQGYVFDGLETKYSTNVPFLMKSLCRCILEKTKKVLVFHLTLDPNRVRDREISIQEAQFQKELQDLKVQELCEEEYDALPQIEKDTYDVAVSKYKARLKEINDKRRRERRLVVEDTRVQDKKTGEEKVRAKRTHSRAATGEKPEKPGAVLGGTRTEKLKKPVSPKFAKKQMEKQTDKDQKHTEKLIDKEFGDDTFGEEYFVNDATFQKMDHYLSTIESTLAVLREKEPEKNTNVKTIPAGGSIVDKKAKGAKNNQPEAVTPALEGDAHPEEIILPEVHEINTNGVDEGTLYQSIQELIPSNEGNYESNRVSAHSLDMCLEKIFYLPKNRGNHSLNKNFTIHAVTPAPEPDDHSELPSSNLTISSTAVPPVKPGTDSKVDPKKPNKTNQKQAEEKGVEQEEEQEKEIPPVYRWILGPNEKKEFVVKYNPTEAIKSNAGLHFEAVGSLEQFSLPCVGVCEYSTLQLDYRKMFAKCRKNRDEKSTGGEFILSTSSYEFGPLLFNKPREKYMDKFPENKGVFTLSNPSSAEVKISLALKTDSKGDNFFFEPQTFAILPGKSQQVSMWAYPRTAGLIEDTMVIMVKDNPEPYCFRLCCTGVKPEVEVEKKTITFDRLLLGRTDKKELKLKNPTHMPIYWKFHGIESLGEEVAITPLEGQIGSFGEQVVHAEFKALKSLSIKKTIKLEIMDAEKIAGIVQEVPVLVTAEAYDISMDVHFPRGFEGGLDFGTLKVGEEGKQLITLKNKGKYEVGFRFLFDSTVFVELLNVTPAQGIIQPSEKPYFVQLVFKSNNEIALKDYPVLKCIVFEPSTGEITASIPVKVSSRSVFSRYSILPARDLNFGALVHGTKSTKQFIIENSGEFEFKYSIFKIMARINDKSGAKLPKGVPSSHNQLKTRPPSPPPASKSTNKKEFAKLADSLVCGPFTVYPTTGMIQPGTKQTITVDFHADTAGPYEDSIGIDISDRSPTDCPDGIEYQLLGESCIPGINITDFASIFEEHSVCKRLELFKTQAAVYGEEDRAFHYGAYLAGQQVQVQFKISNPFKVSCDVGFSTRPRGKSKSDTSDFAFDVEPKRLTIPSHEHRYVSVSFHPSSIQSYSGVFEAMVENVTEGKNKCLSFELRGEGTLPRVTIEKPTTKGKVGMSVLKFKRMLIGMTQTQVIVLKNDGIIPAKFKLEWYYKDNDDFLCKSLNHYHQLRPGESRSIEISCQPSSIRKLEGELKLKVLDNAFEDSTIQIIGEGYLDDLTIENVDDEGDNEITFSDCCIGESKFHTIKLKNHLNDWMRTSFGESQDFTFVPAVCHIPPKEERDVTISFNPKTPCDIQRFSVPIKAAKFRYTNGMPEMIWDDRLKVIRWGNEAGRAGPKKIIESVPEPTIEVMAQLNDYHLTMNAFADYTSFECDLSNVKFKSTLMFQSRVYRLPLRNTGKVSLKFSFDVYNDEQCTSSCSDSPFSISPSSGKVAPGEMIMIAVRFSPIDVGEYRQIVCGKIANLTKEQKNIQFFVEGSSLRPYCHFELEDVDPMFLENRSPEKSLQNGVPFSLDPNTKIIEFKSCGVKVKNVRKFYIVNPTFSSYEYQWKLESADQKSFKCITPKGVVAPNKKSEIVFEFYSESLDTKESLWSFTLAEHNVRIPFLLIGYAFEPNVMITQPGINFKSVLVGRNAKETINLVNEESQPFSFQFNDTSVEMDTQGTPVLNISPMSGTIMPNSEFSVDVTFIPPTEKMFNFNVVCNIRKKPTPVTINVKGEGYVIRDMMLLEMSDSSNLNLTSDSENLVDFGLVQLNEKRVKRVCIVNSGKFNFDFSWKFLKKIAPFTISPEIGTVAKGEKVYCDLCFSPNTVVTHKNVKLVCQIQNGKSYTLSVQGIGSKPLIRLSPAVIDFGSHFITKGSQQPVTKELEICNNDVNEMVIDIIGSSEMWYEFTKGIQVIAPSESVKIPITFCPKDAIQYQDNLKIEVNGLSVVEIPIQGEGSELRIETDSSCVNFGAIRIGNTSIKSIKITNKSKIGFPFSIGPPNTIQYLQSLGVTFSNNTEVFLRPKATTSIDLKFLPHKRIPPFSEEIVTEYAGITKPIFIVSGACQGTEVRLETDTVPFGAVVQKSSTSRKIQLQNVGDIGAKFLWDVSKLPTDFSISPIEGYISPGMDIPIEISFHPTEFNMDIRADNIPCKIEGAGKLYLTLSGMCVSQPNHIDVLKYSTPVRVPEVKSIQITNKSSNQWHICPIIENEYWSGSQYLNVEPGQTKSYDLTFNPLETNGLGEGGKHEGTIFFPLPDGSGLLYKLNGTVDKVLPVNSINREIPCKTLFTEVVTVSNWLKRSQRLKVVPDFGKADPSVVFKGHEFIDLSPMQSKEYKFTYYAYKEGSVNLKVVFKNENTQEYLFYAFNYKNLSPGIISTMEISSPIRQVQSREVVITNPLSIPAVFTGACNHPEVTVPHSFTIQPRSESSVSFEFLPFQPKESTARIVFTSQELGTYQYDLKLTSLPSGLERTLYFKVGLGSQQVQTFRFQSYSKQKTDYTCKIENSEFSVEKTVSAAAATNGPIEISVDVVYEPSRLGDSRGQLIVSSTAGGDYICPLVGHCLSPKPQGPICIKPGGTTTVSFKNVFPASAVFNCIVDNPAFIVKASETIASKKTIALTIGYKQQQEKATNDKLAVKPTSAKTGKLTVTNPTTNISWVYYLRYSNS